MLKLKLYTITLFALSLLFTGTLKSQTIRINVGNDFDRTEYLRGVYEKGDYYLSANSFADALDLSTYYEPNLEKFVFNIDGSRVSLTADNHFVVIGSNIFQLPYAIKKVGSDFYFPVREMTVLLDANLPGSYVYNEDERLMDIFYNNTINITGVDVEERDNGTMVKINTNRGFGKNLTTWFDKEKYTLNLTFYQGALDTLELTNNETRGLVLNTSAYQLPESAQLTFRLSRYVDSHEIVEDLDTGAILISLVNRNAEIPIPETDLGFMDDSTEVNPEIIMASDRENWMIDTIVLDAGHGGRDPGTVGRDGTKEKDLTLDITMRLGKLLENSNLFDKVVYTRKTDEYVSLRQRGKTANDNGGKLFVSIHINANKNSRVRGFSSYFLRPGMNDTALEVLEVVQRENNVVNLSEKNSPDHPLSDEERILLTLTQNAFVHESEILNNRVIEGIGRKIKWPSNGIKQAGFQVLWEATMPHVLVELGFISNSGQLQELKTRAIRQRLAEGLFEGIRKFKDEIGR